MYRLYNNWTGEHLFTTDVDEYKTLATTGWTFEKVVVSYNSDGSEAVTTVTRKGWFGEGKEWLSPSSGTPVYRLYNPFTGDHHYTADEGECESLTSLGWRQEGVTFYSGEADDTGAQPIYRLFNPWLTQGTHLFTTDADEYAALGEAGWQQEGVAFYASTNWPIYVHAPDPAWGTPTKTVYGEIQGQIGTIKVYYDGVSEEQIAAYEAELDTLGYGDDGMCDVDENGGQIEPCWPDEWGQTEYRNSGRWLETQAWERCVISHWDSTQYLDDGTAYTTTIFLTEGYHSMG